MLSIAIQAGGESRRMGQNKALMPFLGRPLIAYLLDRLAASADELFITAREPGPYAALGRPVYTDASPQRGALGGLLTALQHARHPVLAAVACDMPFASPELLRFQARLLDDEQADIVVPAGEAGLEPLHALYRTATCLPAAQAALQRGDWKLSGWFERVRTRVVTRAEWESFDPQHVIFTNLNTPDDFQKAEAYARKTGGFLGR